MLKSIRFLSQNNFENRLRLPENETSIAISITDPNARAARAPRGLEALLKLSFDDTCEEDFGIEAGSLPDVHSDAEKGVRLFLCDDELFDAVDAKRILEFLRSYADKPQPYAVYVHCRAGVSRSAAVALFVRERFGCPMDLDADVSRANKRVLRVLNKLASGSQPSVGSIGTVPVKARTEVQVQVDGRETVLSVHAESSPGHFPARHLK